MHGLAKVFQEGLTFSISVRFKQVLIKEEPRQCASNFSTTLFNIFLLKLFFYVSFMSSLLICSVLFLLFPSMGLSVVPVIGMSA